MATGSKIIVTGAAQGLGRAVALRLAVPGMHVACGTRKAGAPRKPQCSVASAEPCREPGRSM
jgi:NAD(P)-dependent dehydrogenase (short-subunit alcohol dehydrogenase family)